MILLSYAYECKHSAYFYESPLLVSPLLCFSPFQNPLYKSSLSHFHLESFLSISINTIILSTTIFSSLSASSSIFLLFPWWSTLFI